MKIKKKHKQQLKTGGLALLAAAVAGALSNNPQASGYMAAPPILAMLPYLSAPALPRVQRPAQGSFYRPMSINVMAPAIFTPVPVEKIKPSRRTPLDLRPPKVQTPALPEIIITVDPAKAIILDPGHGGEDEGAVSRGVKEKELCLAISKKLQLALEKEGGPKVLLTRDADSFVALDKRIDSSLEWDGGVFVSIHINQIRDKKASGAIIYSYGPGSKRARHRHKYRYTLPPALAAPPKSQARESALLAALIVKEFRTEGLKVKSPERQNFYVLKNPRLPSVLIELGFLTNPEEGARLADPAYQDRLAATVARGIRSYLLEKTAKIP